MLFFFVCGACRMQSACSCLARSRKELPWAAQLKARLYSSHPPSCDRRLPPPSPYKLLGLEEHAPWKRVKAQYIFLAKLLHPDAISLGPAAAGVRHPPAAPFAAAAAVDQAPAALEAPAAAASGRTRSAAAAAAVARGESRGACVDGSSSFFSLGSSLYNYAAETQPFSHTLPRTFEDVHWAYETIKAEVQLRQQQERQQQQQQQHTWKTHRGGEDVDRTRAVWGCPEAASHAGAAAARVRMQQHQQQERAAALRAWRARQEAAANFWEKQYATSDGATSTGALTSAGAVRPVAAAAAAAYSSPGPEATPPASSLATAGAAAPSSPLAVGLYGAPAAHPEGLHFEEKAPQQQAGGSAGVYVHASYFGEAFQRRLQAERLFPHKNSRRLSLDSDSAFENQDECERRKQKPSPAVHTPTDTSWWTEKPQKSQKYYVTENYHENETDPCDTHEHLCITQQPANTETCKTTTNKRPRMIHKGKISMWAAGAHTQQQPAATAASDQQTYEQERQQHISELQQLLCFSEEETRSAAEALGLLPSTQSKICRRDGGERSRPLQPSTQTLLCCFLVVTATAATLFITARSSRQKGVERQQDAAWWRQLLYDTVTRRCE